MMPTKRSLVAVLFATVVVLCFASKAEAKKGCSNANLSGTYGMSLTGTWQGFAGVTGPVADVGQLVSDGAGNVTGLDVVSLNGTIASVPFTGTYSIASSCLGTVTINATGFPPLNLSMSLVNGGNQVLLIQTDSLTTVAGSAKSF
jgi:hypothetical protein